MNNMMIHRSIFVSIVRCYFLVGLCLFVTTSLYSQEESTFAQKGTLELGGSISFRSDTQVTAGQSEEAVTVFTIAPYIGYFVADGFEIGLNPLGYSSASFWGLSVTQIMVFVAPSYNFKTESIAYPFVEALLGYTSQSGAGTSLSGFSWGGRGGVKLAVADKGLLNVGVQYLKITLNPSGATDRNGSNQFSFSTGFTVWF
jgi:hypothetical protein